MSTRMPVFFLAHGSPINALEDNYFVADWHRLHQGTPAPAAIVVFSAHWETAGTRISSNDVPPTIHDFGGFPPALYQQHYPCPGSPQLATTIAGTLMQYGFQAALDNSWGLDHGSWVILKHLYPDADIPVLQISLDRNQPDLLQHYRIGQALREYRDQGVLFIGSGNIVHNIRKWMTARPGDAIDWAVDFDRAIASAIEQHDINTLASYHTLPFAREAVPTVEHYLPLLYVMGLADNQDRLAFSDFGFHDLSTACSRSLRFAAA
ncbi:MAG TPA: 4,5-DOPA dioxygenase extradiol [Pseudomonadales bacterium]